MSKIKIIGGLLAVACELPASLLPTSYRLDEVVGKRGWQRRFQEFFTEFKRHPKWRIMLGCAVLTACTSFRKAMVGSERVILDAGRLPGMSGLDYLDNAKYWVGCSSFVTFLVYSFTQQACCAYQTIQALKSHPSWEAFEKKHRYSLYFARVFGITPNLFGALNGCAAFLLDRNHNLEITSWRAIGFCAFLPANTLFSVVFFYYAKFMVEIVKYICLRADNTNVSNQIVAHSATKSSESCCASNKNHLQQLLDGLHTLGNWGNAFFSGLAMIFGITGVFYVGNALANDFNSHELNDTERYICASLGTVVFLCTAIQSYLVWGKASKETRAARQKITPCSRDNYGTAGGDSRLFPMAPPPTAANSDDHENGSDLANYRSV